MDLRYGWGDQILGLLFMNVYFRCSSLYLQCTYLSFIGCTLCCNDVAIHSACIMLMFGLSLISCMHMKVDMYPM